MVLVTSIILVSIIFSEINIGLIIPGNWSFVADFIRFNHISDIKKTDMITKLICQLPDHDAFGRRG